MEEKILALIPTVFTMGLVTKVFEVSKLEYPEVKYRSLGLLKKEVI